MGSLLALGVMLLSFLVAVSWAPWYIGLLRRRHLGKQIRQGMRRQINPLSYTSGTLQDTDSAIGLQPAKPPNSPSSAGG